MSLCEQVLRSRMLKILPSVLNYLLLPPYQHAAITSPALCLSADLLALPY